MVRRLGGNRLLGLLLNHIFLPTSTLERASGGKSFRRRAGSQNANGSRGYPPEPRMDAFLGDGLELGADIESQHVGA